MRSSAVMARTCFGVLRACRMERNMKARKRIRLQADEKIIFGDTAVFGGDGTHAAVLL